MIVIIYMRSDSAYAYYLSKCFQIQCQYYVSLIGEWSLCQLYDGNQIFFRNIIKLIPIQGIRAIGHILKTFRCHISKIAKQK